MKSTANKQSMDAASGRKILLFPCTLLVFVLLYSLALAQSSQGGDWRPVPLQGKIRMTRSMDFETSFGGAGLIKEERANMVISVDDTARVKRAGSLQLFTQGKVVTTVQGREIWDLGDQGSFTHSYRLFGKEPFGPDTKLTKQRVYLEVNANKGLYRLKVPEGRAKGQCESTVKVGEKEKTQTKEIDMELEAWFPDGQGEVQGSYDPETGKIQGQYQMTGYHLPGGPVFGEEKPKIWSSGDPDIPEIEQKVGKEKLIPVEYKVSWKLSLKEQEEQREGPLPGPTSGQMAGLDSEDEIFSGQTNRTLEFGTGDEPIRTEKLQMTGLHAERRVVPTDCLRMTGLSRQERVIRTQALQMSGIEPVDRLIRTDALHMKGLGQEEQEQ